MLTRILVLVVAAIGLGGCAAYKAPRLTVAHAHPVERTEQGVAMEFILDARNDNDVSLPLRDVTYTVEVDGREVFRGTRSAESTLRRLGTQQVRLPAVINLSQFGHPPSPAGYRIAGTLTYVTPGQIAEILFDTGVRVPSVGFSGEGQISLDGPPAPQG